MPAPIGPSLDPDDWDDFRRDAHRTLDTLIHHLRTIRDRPVWTEPPPEARVRFHATLPHEGRALDSVLDDVATAIVPYATGNLHPAFMGWVHGSGTPVGMLAEMIAGGLNLNCGGRNHIGLDVENQITRWMADAFGFPDTASGLFVTGSSMANFMGVIVARTAALGPDVRRTGLPADTRLLAYASAAAHGCITQAMQLAGLGSDRLRLVPCAADGAMDIVALRSMIAADRADGARPFLVIGTAGTVDTGAIDPLAAIADVAETESLWFHVDGAFGALGVLAPELRPLLAGIGRAQSIACDFHKWGQVPYDAGFLLVRDGALHRAAFASANRYLGRAATGLAAGETWPCDLGPDLSRGFRALKTWMTLSVLGTDRLGRSMVRLCELAQRLAAHVAALPAFEVVAPVRLNIVCLSVRGASAGRLNGLIVEHLHGTGEAAPSVTLLHGRPVIRCAINNHRTCEADIDAVAAALERARRAVLAAASEPEGTSEDESTIGSG